MSIFLSDKEEGAENRLRVSFKFSENMETTIVGDTISDLITGLEGLGNAQFINEFISKMDLSEEQFGRLDTMILDTRNVGGIRKYLSLRNYQVNNVDSFERVLLELGDIEAMVEFSRYNQGKYFKQIEDAVIASGKEHAIYCISKIPGADLKRIKKVLWESDNIGDCLNFYKDHKDDKELIVPEDVKFLEELAMNLKEESFVCSVAENVDGVDLEKLSDIIAAQGNGYYIIRFARLLKGSKSKDIVAKLQEAVIKVGDASYICEFGSIEGANLSVLYKALKHRGDKYYIRKFKSETGYRAFW